MGTTFRVVAAVFVATVPGIACAQLTYSYASRGAYLAAITNSGRGELPFSHPGVGEWHEQTQLHAFHTYGGQNQEVVGTIELASDLTAQSIAIECLGTAEFWGCQAGSGTVRVTGSVSANFSIDRPCAYSFESSHTGVGGWTTFSLSGDPPETGAYFSVFAPSGAGVLAAGAYALRLHWDSPDSAPHNSPDRTDEASAAFSIVFTYLACNAADLGGAGAVRMPDGLLDNNDFIAFIDYFFLTDPRADFGSQGGVAFADGAFDNNDFIVFIDQFFAGCG